MIPARAEFVSPWDADQGAEDDAVPWEIPAYSRSQVNRAGEAIVDPSGLDAADYIQALLVVHNWRSSHSFPLNYFQMRLRRCVEKLDPDGIVAQRLKRFPSIEKKLRVEPTMKLSTMHDIGGCRAIVGSTLDVYAVSELYTSGGKRHEMIREYDYIQSPKPTGYRGIHLTFRYRSPKGSPYDGLRVEVQIRTALQHAWATTVETVDTFTRLAIKSGRADSDWATFFKLMGSAMASRESSPGVPGVPDDPRELRKQLRRYAKLLDAEKRLNAYKVALTRPLDRISADPASLEYLILRMDFETRMLSWIPYRKTALDEAQHRYAEMEQEAANNPNLDVVLVKVGSLASLRRAYPNYFMDTTEFINAMNLETIGSLCAE